METQDIILAAVGAIVVLAGGGFALFRSRSRGSSGPSDPTRTTASAPPAAGAAAAERVTVVAVEERAVGALEGASAPGSETAAPTVERPESAAGRMVRLRDRLSRSGALGKTL